jgi:hypothetical protein
MAALYHVRAALFWAGAAEGRGMVLYGRVQVKKEVRHADDMQIDLKLACAHALYLPVLRMRSRCVGQASNLGAAQASQATAPKEAGRALSQDYILLLAPVTAVMRVCDTDVCLIPDFT